MAKKLNTEIFLQRVQDSNLEMFNKYNYDKTEYKKLSEKVLVNCPEHGDFSVWPGDHMKGMSGCQECIKEKRKKTLIDRYGVDNFFKRTDLIEQAMIGKYGVKNAGMLKNHREKCVQTSLNNYGVEWGAVANEVQEKRKKTNLKRYGVEVPMMNKAISSKMIKTKIKKGTFTKSNSSKEATRFIRQYINSKGYNLDQCAYADSTHNLFEWGYYANNQWIMYDLVVFESGYRGNKNKIIEILEYHGPFHYLWSDVQQRGDANAYPWKTNKTTIKESFNKDQEKEILGRQFTDNYTIIWSDLYHSNDRKQGDL